MILTQTEIRAAIRAGEIRFDPPLEEKQWGGVSIDLRLGTQFTKPHRNPGIKLALHGGLSDLAACTTKELPIRDEFGKLNTFCLEPDEFVLAMTHESLTLPRNLIAMVEGRSTYARLGLSVHQTAPWIQPGWAGRIVLEIKNHGPARIELTPLLDRPCQLVFIQLMSTLPETLAYGCKASDMYANQSHPLQGGGSVLNEGRTASQPSSL
jgi:dCTP deaminase